MTLMRGSFAAFVASLLCLTTAAQSASLNGFQSSDDDTRMAAFYALLNPLEGEKFDAADLTSRLMRSRPEDAAALASSLISLLERENLRVQRPFDERFSNYYGDLIWSVASLRDARAVPALLGAVQTGGLATDGLASLGVAALPSVLAALNTADRGVRNGILRVLAKLATPRAQVSLDAESTTQIRAALLLGLEDEDAFNRVAAIRGLVNFQDADVRSAMARAASDASDRVREIANDWLRRHPPP